MLEGPCALACALARWSMDSGFDTDVCAADDCTPSAPRGEKPFSSVGYKAAPNGDLTSHPQSSTQYRDTRTVEHRRTVTQQTLSGKQHTTHDTPTIPESETHRGERRAPLDIELRTTGAAAPCLAYPKPSHFCDTATPSHGLHFLRDASAASLRRRASARSRSEPIAARVSSTEPLAFRFAPASGDLVRLPRAVSLGR